MGGWNAENRAMIFEIVVGILLAVLIINFWPVVLLLGALSLLLCVCGVVVVGFGASMWSLFS
jgi:hypothetical protein